MAILRVFGNWVFVFGDWVFVSVSCNFNGVDGFNRSFVRFHWMVVPLWHHQILNAGREFVNRVFKAAAQNEMSDAFWQVTQRLVEIRRNIRVENHMCDAVRKVVDALVEAVPKHDLYNAVRKVVDVLIKHETEFQMGDVVRNQTVDWLVKLVREFEGSDFGTEFFEIGKRVDCHGVSCEAHFVLDYLIIPQNKLIQFYLSKH